MNFEQHLCSKSSKSFPPFPTCQVAKSSVISTAKPNLTPQSRQQTSSTSHSLLLITDNWRHIRFLHLRIDCIILPQNTSGHASSCNQQRHRDDLESDLRLVCRQEDDASAHVFLLHRVCVQRLVHDRDSGECTLLTWPE